MQVYLFVWRNLSFYMKKPGHPTWLLTKQNLDLTKHLIFLKHQPGRAEKFYSLSLLRTNIIKSTNLIEFILNYFSEGIIMGFVARITDYLVKKV